MEPTSLAVLLKEEGVTCAPDGLLLDIQPSWIIEGEDRLSYATLVRLIECCREHHWNLDVLSKGLGSTVDSITRSIAGEFLHPILIGSAVSITYQVTGVRRRGYSLKFEVRDVQTGIVSATFEMVCVFYDPVARRVAEPPSEIVALLTELCSAPSTVEGPAKPS